MSSIVRRTLHYLRDAWQERRARAHAQTYEGARAALGGAPWLEAPKSTDAWFIIDDQKAAASAPPRSRRSLAVLVSVLGVAALTMGIAIVSRGIHRAAPVVPAQIASPPPVAAAPAA